MVPSRFVLNLTLFLLFQGMNSLKGQESYEEKLNGVNHNISMVFIEGGSFIMGSPKTEVGHFGDEGPEHEVEIAPFGWDNMK